MRRLRAEAQALMEGLKSEVVVGSGVAPRSGGLASDQRANRQTPGVRSVRRRPPVDFIVSIDTEEDNWIPARTGITTRNVSQLPELAVRFERQGIRPTYFVSYQVTVCSKSAETMRSVIALGDAEVGAHLHPWNTPPESGLEDNVTMLMNYPTAVQARKIRTLLEAIESNLHVRPTSFRAGRFGFSASTIPALIENDIYVDSSVTPLLTWETYDDGPNFTRAPFSIYSFDAEDPLRPIGDQGNLTEVPISVGCTRFGPNEWPFLARMLESPVARRLRLAGLAHRTKLFRKVVLSPEISTAHEMVEVSRRLVAGGARHLHMFFHSNSLAAGTGPFSHNRADVEALLDRIDECVDGLSEFADLSFCTVSEAARRHSTR